MNVHMSALLSLSAFGLLMSLADMQVNCHLPSRTVYCEIWPFVKCWESKAGPSGGKTDTLGALSRDAHAPRSRSTAFAMYFIINILQSPTLHSWQWWRLLTL
jgi:hypothetical protein